MHIGIIHTAFIGDIILSGLLVEALHRSGHKITFFTKEKTSPIFAHDKRISKVVVLKKPSGIKKLFSLYKISKQIADQNLDALICPHKSLTTTLCAYFSGVKVTIGFENAVCAFLYKYKRPFVQSDHECIKYLSLLPSFICPKDILKTVTQIGRPILNYDFSDLLKKGIIEQESLPLPKSYFIVALGSVWQTKKYESAYLLDICKKILNANPNLKCYLTGDKNDRADCKAFEEKLNEYGSRIVNRAGLGHLMDFIAVSGHAKFILCNDSSPLHLSSAFNVPVICFFGPTVVEFGFGPLADQNLVISHKTVFGENLDCQPCGPHGAKKCPKGHHLCMKKLVPNLVQPKIDKFLTP